MPVIVGKSAVKIVLIVWVWIGLIVIDKWSCIEDVILVGLIRSRHIEIWFWMLNVALGLIVECIVKWLSLFFVVLFNNMPVSIWLQVQIHWIWNWFAVSLVVILVIVTGHSILVVIRHFDLRSLQRILIFVELQAISFVVLLACWVFIHQLLIYLILEVIMPWTLFNHFNRLFQRRTVEVPIPIALIKWGILLTDYVLSFKMSLTIDVRSICILLWLCMGLQILFILWEKVILRLANQFSILLVSLFIPTLQILRLLLPIPIASRVSIKVFCLPLISLF